MDMDDLLWLWEYEPDIIIIYLFLNRISLWFRWFVITRLGIRIASGDTEGGWNELTCIFTLSPSYDDLFVSDCILGTILRQLEIREE